MTKMPSSMEYRFSLEKGSKKYPCPACGRRKKFVRYKDNLTGEYLPYQIGRCERIIKCGYHYKPADYFRDNPLVLNSFREEHRTFVEPVQSPAKIPDYISPSLVVKSLSPHHTNHFTKWLKSLFGTQITEKLIDKFRIGTSKRWPGATVFWQIDIDLKVRSGKVMLYDPYTGSRVKRNGKSHIDWVHSILLRKGKLSNFNLQQCLFGEHQLSQDTVEKTVAIVESEKTAIVMSVIYPDFLWMACGSATNIKSELFRPLIGRRIVLYPDLKGYNQWLEKAYELNRQGYQVTVSELLEKKATTKDKSKGLDLVDYFVKRDRTGMALTDEGYPIIWDI